MGDVWLDYDVEAAELSTSFEVVGDPSDEDCVNDPLLSVEEAGNISALEVFWVEDEFDSTGAEELGDGA